MNTQVQTYRTLCDNPRETEKTCLELIRRHGPLLMRAGGSRGGRMPEAAVIRAARAMTTAQRAERERRRVELGERMLALRRAGVSYRKIGDELGVPPRDVQRFCVARGIAVGRRRANLTAEQINAIRALRVAGKGQGAIAQEMGLSRSVVNYRLRLMGLTKTYRRGGKA